MLLLNSAACPVTLRLAASHAPWGATTALFRRNCPAWLTPALLAEAGYRLVAPPLPPAPLPSFAFEAPPQGPVRFVAVVTATGEFRHCAVKNGRLWRYSQHLPLHAAAFAETVRGFEQEALRAPRKALGAV